LTVGVTALEKPLPKPRKDLLGYASARALEALVEALLALYFLDKGYTRNAAGKAFLAWRALTGALLALCAEKIAGRLESEEEKKWLLEKAIPKIPTTRLKTLAMLVQRACVPDYSFYTSTALDLHDYQYHGPDPDLELSKYRSRREAALDIIQLLGKLAVIIEKHLKPRLEEEKQWTTDHEEVLDKLKQGLEVHQNPHRR